MQEDLLPLPEGSGLPEAREQRPCPEEDSELHCLVFSPHVTHQAGKSRDTSPVLGSVPNILPLRTPRHLAGSSWQAEPVPKLTLPFLKPCLSVPLSPAVKESFWERMGTGRGQLLCAPGSSSTHHQQISPELEAGLPRVGEGSGSWQGEVPVPPVLPQLIITLGNCTSGRGGTPRGSDCRCGAVDGRRKLLTGIGLQPGSPAMPGM